MGTRSKVVAIAILTGLLVSLVPLAAQTSTTWSMSGIVSNGLIKTDADNIGDVNRFTGIQTTIFSAAFFSATTVYTGFGTKLGGLYLGTSYSGNILANVGANGVNASGSSVNTTEYLSADGNIVQISRTTGTYAANKDTTSNNGSLLIGFGPIGIQVAVDQVNNKIADKTDGPIPTFNANTNWAGTTTFGANQSDSKTTVSAVDAAKTVKSETVTTYTNGYYSKDSVGNVISAKNSLTPKLTLGADLPIGDLQLRPYLFVSYALVDGGRLGGRTMYTTTPNAGLPTYKGIANLYSYDSYVSTQKDQANVLSIGAGAGLQMSDMIFGLGYSLGMDMYANAYTDIDGSSKTIAGTSKYWESTNFQANSGGVVGQTAETTIKGYEAAEKSSMTHLITPSIQVDGKSDRLNYAWSVAPTITMINTSEKATGKAIRTIRTFVPDNNPASSSTQVETKTYQGSETTTSSLTVEPVFAGTIQYAVIPDVLMFNVGTKITLPKFYNQVSKTVDNGINTYKSETTWDNGTTTLNAADANLGRTRTESSTTKFDINGVALNVKAGATWSLTKNVDFDVILGAVGGGTMLNLANTTFALVIRK